MSLIASSEEARTSVAYGLPFTYVPELSHLIDVLNGDDGSGTDETKREISEALTANVTTVEGQRKLLSTARKHHWLDESQNEVNVAVQDGIEGFGHFYTSFTASLKFYVTAVEGNHRLIALLAALLRCKVKRESGYFFKPSNPGDPTFLTNSFVGIEDNEHDAMENALEKLKKSDSDAILSHPFDAHITVASRTATESFPAPHLAETLLAEKSKNVSKRKLGSTVLNIYRGLTKHNSVRRDHEDWTEKEVGTNGKIVSKGKVLTIKGLRARTARTLEEFEDDPSFTEEPLTQYYENPMREYETCQNEVQLRVDGGGPNDVLKLPVKCNMDNFGSTGNYPMTVEHSMARFFPLAVAVQSLLETDGMQLFTSKQISAMLAGGIIMPRSGVNTIVIPKDDTDGKYNDTPKLWDRSVEGIMATSTAALVYTVESAKLFNAGALLDQTLNAFSIMSQTKDMANDLRLSIGKNKLGIISFVNLCSLYLD